MDIYIVVPAFNEAKRISKVLEELSKTKFPVVVVDDGSTDSTFQVASRIKNKDLRFTILRHEVNLGKGAAMKTGAEAAFRLGADAVVFMDSDGQHLINDLPQFTKALDKGFDIVFGTRNLNYGVPLARYLGNKFASIYISVLFGIYVSDILCGFRGLSKNGYKIIHWESQGYGVETEMVVRTAKTGIRNCEVPVTTLYYDKFKGVSLLDSFNIFFSVIRWRLRK